ncbi:MAG: N-6 DNA methylase, partial [Gracilimonas sp.]
DYSEFKHDIFESVKKHNPDYDPLLLFKKTQKLLDRFLFIFFAEDRNLLPPNSIKKIIQQWHQLKELDEYRPLYERFVKYFGYLNEGRNMAGKDEIFAYNGGLFAEDEILDDLTISDDLLYKHTLQLSNYDFVSEVDVNILGHIFEHSLNEIEEINAELKGEEVDTSKTRRKKDGVFYTPKYITKYIVENTVGKLCEEKKAELDIEDEEYRPNRQKKTKKDLLAKLENYRDWLLELTICDPACGSGAFLNQALEFLIAEHNYIDELKGKILNQPLELSDIDNQILERNLFGVDINEESVEIAKLSLWLRTARKGRKLTSLNNHIKCGNSLIDDPEVAGDKAFDWEAEFPSVFENGGFDVVIGNPPYVPTEFIAEKEKEYLENIYDSAFGRINLYPIFYEKGIQILKQKGLLSFITPYTILKNQYYKEARKYILENTSIDTLVDFKGITVFADAAVDSIILVLNKSSVSDNKYYQIFNIRDFQTLQFDTSEIVQGDILNSDDLSFNVSLHEKLIKRISKKCIPVSKVIDFNQGIITGGNKKFITSEKGDLTKKVITGRDFVRYYVFPSSNYVIYDTDNLHRPRKKEIFEVDEKILLRQTSAYP